MGRILSGVGEASIAAISVPFIDDMIEPAKKGLYIAIYFTAIPVGTAVGFIWAGQISAATNGQWGWAFLGEVRVLLSRTRPPTKYFS